MRNIALFLTYEGTAYHGWQTQKNLATVQQTIEKAIEKIDPAQEYYIGRAVAAQILSKYELIKLCLTIEDM